MADKTELSRFDIGDLELYQQNPVYYLKKKDSNDFLVPLYIQERISQQHTRHVLSPWHQKYGYSSDYLKNQVFQYKNTPFFGENGLQVPQNKIMEWIENSHSADFPNTNQNAITLQNASLRLLPTEHPLFYDPSLPGEGYPFDMLQNSYIPAGTPLRILHISQDKAWAYVASAIAEGWVPIRGINRVTEDFIAVYEKTAWIVITKDTAKFYEHDRYLFDGYIGMSFPLIRQTETDWIVGVPIGSEIREAKLIEVTIPKSVSDLKPVPITKARIAEMATHMIGQPYGWGGLYGNRDCASMIQDLFTPFGIWLPRNGNDQGLEGGLFFKLKHLNPQDKETTIIENGLPFMTLLWLKGHIMLYVGSEKGHALVLHNIWGVRTKDNLGKEGRKVLGRTVITSLQPGKELPTTDPKTSLLSRVEAMTYLIPRYE